jgi:hypothetical protein
VATATRADLALADGRREPVSVAGEPGAKPTCRWELLVGKMMVGVELGGNCWCGGGRASTSNREAI